MIHVCIYARIIRVMGYGLYISCAHMYLCTCAYYDRTETTLLPKAPIYPSMRLCRNLARKEVLSHTSQQTLPHEKHRHQTGNIWIFEAYFCFQNMVLHNLHLVYGTSPVENKSLAAGVRCGKNLANESRIDPDILMSKRADGLERVPVHVFERTSTCQRIDRRDRIDRDRNRGQSYFAKVGVLENSGLCGLQRHGYLAFHIFILALEIKLGTKRLLNQRKRQKRESS
jgi:hypothetical protein